MIFQTTPEEMARSLWPGLNAITAKAIEKAMCDEYAKHIKEWADTYLLNAIVGVTSENGKIKILLEVNLDNGYKKSN